MKKITGPLKQLPILFLIAYILIEGAALTALCVRDLIGTKFDFVEVIRLRMGDFRLAGTQNISFGGYDPVSHYWMRVGTVIEGDLIIGNKGFPENGQNDPRSALFAEKPSGLTRGYLLGDSSAIGVGVQFSRETLSAQLEELLNQRGKKNKDEYIQVLNFGQIGSWSGDTLAKYINYLAYGNPDFVILYNGFNDARLRHNVPDILNWGPSSKNVFLTMSSAGTIADKKVPRVKYLPYTSAFFDWILKKAYIHEEYFQENFEKYLSETPIPSTITKHHHSNREKNQLASAWATNIDFLAQILSSRSIALLVILQPNQYISGQDYVGEGEEVRAEIEKNYEIFKSDLLILQKKFLSSPHIQFLDFSEKFSENPQEVFADWVHLNKKGNEAMAKAISAFYPFRNY